MTRTNHLIAGHDLIKDPGAVSGKLKEANLTVEFKNILKRELEFLGVKVTTDNDKDNLVTVLSKLRSVVKPDDIVIDIHFNASDNIQAHGSEIFIRDNASAVEKQLAKDLQASLCQTLGTRDRGVKTESQSARKRLGVMRLPCLVILLELGFITNSPDHEKYFKMKHILGARFADILQEVSK